jgi:hypothetical protein
MVFEGCTTTRSRAGTAAPPDLRHPITNDPAEGGRRQVGAPGEGPARAVVPDGLDELAMPIRPVPILHHLKGDAAVLNHPCYRVRLHDRPVVGLHGERDA